MLQNSPTKKHYMTIEQTQQLDQEYLKNLKQKYPLSNIGFTYPKENAEEYGYFLLVYKKHFMKEEVLESTIPHTGIWGTEDCILLINKPEVLASSFIDHNEFIRMHSWEYTYAKGALEFILKYL